jgi:hypothetical protein
MTKSIILTHCKNETKVSIQSIKELIGLGFISIGSDNKTLKNHQKPKSLDFFLRLMSESKDTKQATNDVVKDILSSGLFRVINSFCPDSGRKCKGLILNGML